MQPLLRYRDKSAIAIAAAAMMIVSGPSLGMAKEAPSSQHAALKSALKHELENYLKQRGAKEHLSSLSLSISLRNTDSAIDVTAGTTRYKSGPPVTPSSLYQIGSNTKAFTAVAVLQLEAQGRLSINAPLSTYLPQYPAYGKLTLRQLLSMTGGIESYDNLPAWYPGL